MEITYVYDKRYETYRRIMKETDTMYKIANGDGDWYEMDKPENPKLKTLIIAHVGDRIYHTSYKEYGTIDKVDINDYNQTYRVKWDNRDTMHDWPATENVIVIDY